MQVITKAKYQEILLIMIDNLKSKSTTHPNDLKVLTDAYEDSKSEEFEKVESIHVDGKFTFKPIRTSSEHHFNFVNADKDGEEL